MVNAVDSKSTLDARVHALATRVNNLSECKLRYEDAGKPKFINGIVTAETP